jgi:hypothetical protein
MTLNVGLWYVSWNIVYVPILSVACKDTELVNMTRKTE